MLHNSYRYVRSKLPLILRFRPNSVKRYLPLIFICLFIVCIFSILRKIELRLKNNYVTVDLQDFNSVKLYYDEVVPEKTSGSPGKLTTVLLLYHESVTRTWESIGTVEFLRKQGYRVITLYVSDLFSGTTPWPTHPLKGAVLAEAMKKINAAEAVIVVPGFTGSYGLPLVIRGGFALKGFVAISPSDTDKFTRKEFQILKIPSLIVYGSNDKASGASGLDNLRMIPNKEIVEMPNAGHFCHLDKTADFHKILIKFLEGLK